MKRFSFILCAFWLSFPLSAQDITFATGSCAHGGQPERDSIFNALSDEPIDFFLWLGDNIYYRYGDWKNEATMRAAYDRRQNQSYALRNFLKNTTQRAIWDDHDYGPNDSDSTFTGRNTALKVFASIWPETPLNPEKYGDIRWHELRGNTLFIGMDNRMHRGPVGTHMLGDNQLRYLDSVIQAYPEAPFIFVAIGSQVINEAQVWENYSRYPERDKLLEICAKHPGQVIFLTGDRHHSEINRNPEGLVEFCVSPLTSKCYPPRDIEIEQNTNLIPETVISIPNYAVIQVFERKRVVIITYKDAEGNILLTQSIRSKLDS